MQTALLLIGALLQPPPEKVPTLYIRLGDNHESRLLKSELTRNWFNVRSLKDYPSAYVFHREQQSIRAKIEFVTVDRWAGLKTPAYRIGRYGKWERFDTRTFSFTGRPTRTVKWIVDSYLTEPLEITYERRTYSDGTVWFSSSTKENKRPRPPWEKPGQ